jgi:hypothetical protein
MKAVLEKELGGDLDEFGSPVRNTDRILDRRLLAVWSARRLFIGRGLTFTGIFGLSTTFLRRRGQGLAAIRII